MILCSKVTGGPLACSVDTDRDEVFLFAGLVNVNIQVEREWKILYNPNILAPGNNTK